MRILDRRHECILIPFVIFRCGMNQWITKPIRRATILAEVNAGMEFLKCEVVTPPNYSEVMPLEN